MTPDALAQAVAGVMPGAQRDLERLVRIPSIAFAGFPREPLGEAAEAVVAILRDAGLDGAEAIEVPDGARAPPARGGGQRIDALAEGGLRVSVPPRLRAARRPTLGACPRGW